MNCNVNRNVASRLVVTMVLLATCFLSGGATCSKPGPVLNRFPPPPPTLQPAASLDQVVAAVNRTASIRELSTNTASVEVLSMPAIPTLNATMAMRREKEFRLRASLPIVMGSGLDMGSNRELFWFEVPEGISKTLYFARHADYARRQNRAILPVDPSWVMDALGLVQLDAKQIVRGPVLRPDGKLEVRSVIPTPAGLFQRVCYIDAAGGHVTDQRLYDPSDKLVAESHATNHLYDETVNCSLPHSIELKLTPATDPPLHLRIDVGSYAINEILSGDPNLFVIPQGAANVVDLSTVGPMPVASTGPATTTPVAGRLQNTTGIDAYPASYRTTNGQYTPQVSHALPLRGVSTPIVR
ncbi:MAG: hypothetical protein AAFV88_05465 [Planctomycetota bacterium]